MQVQLSELNFLNGAELLTSLAGLFGSCRARA